MKSVRRAGIAGSLFALVLVAACSQSTPLEPTSVPQHGPSAEQTEYHGGGSGGTNPPSPTNALAIASSAMGSGNIGASYAAYVTSSGGKGTPHTFKLVAGQLPGGLTMASSYGTQSTIVSGKPAATGTWSFTVQVRDQSGNTATKALSITINAPKPLVITNQSDTLAPGKVGASYALNLFASNGVQPYRWAVVEGQLPPGIGLGGNRLSGTPNTAGTFTFTARVTDNAGKETSRTFTIDVSQ